MSRGDESSKMQVGRLERGGSTACAAVHERTTTLSNSVHRVRCCLSGLHCPRRSHSRDNAPLAVYSPRPFVPPYCPIRPKHRRAGTVLQALRSTYVMAVRRHRSRSGGLGRKGDVISRAICQSGLAPGPSPPASSVPDVALSAIARRMNAQALRV